MAVKYIWWGHARNMVAVYPVRKEQYRDLIEISIVPANDGMPHGTKVSNPVESTMISAEAKEPYREYWAVRQALEVLSSKSNGEKFLDFVRMYYWEKPRLRLDQVARRLGVSLDTVSNWNRTLLYQVGRNRGWI